MFCEHTRIILLKNLPLWVPRPESISSSQMLWLWWTAASPYMHISDTLTVVVENISMPLGLPCCPASHEITRAWPSAGCNSLLLPWIAGQQSDLHFATVFAYAIYVWHKALSRAAIKWIQFNKLQKGITLHWSSEASLPIILQWLHYHGHSSARRS